MDKSDVVKQEVGWKILTELKGGGKTGETIERGRFVYFRFDFVWACTFPFKERSNLKSGVGKGIVMEIVVNNSLVDGRTRDVGRGSEGAIWQMATVPEVNR